MPTDPAPTTHVFLVRGTIMSGRGGMPSIAYRACLYDRDTGREVARTKGLSPWQDWRTAGEALARRKGWIIVANPKG